jgi:uncharacterized iron-regulated membrane protein
MNFRRILFWIHLCAGVIAGIVILIMCVTGIALAFERQINELADRAGRAPVTAHGTRLPIDRLLAANPAQAPTAITIYASPDEPVASPTAASARSLLLRIRARCWARTRRRAGRFSQRWSAGTVR